MRLKPKLKSLPIQAVAPVEAGRAATIARGVRTSLWSSRFTTLLIAALIFTVGVGVGNGRITLGLQRGGYQAASGQLPKNLDFSSVDQLYQSLKDNYNGNLTTTQLTDGLKHGLAESTKDPYTVYFTAKEAKSFEDDLNNSFSGIGAQLGQDADGNLEIVAPIAGLPAEKAGLQPKDIIINVNGQTTSGLSIDDAVRKIRGPKGTSVKLEIVRNKSEDLNFTITRDDIVLPSINTKTLDSNIGYIQITTFANDTSRLASEAATKFKTAGVKAIVLDLRGNPGGLLDAAVNVSSLWLPAGSTVLQEKRGSTVIQDYRSTGIGTLSGIPTVVLINPGSASASEITAGALHDNKAAYLIGEKSYGKGVVQSLINFNDGSQLKVTIASWFRPNGQNINHKGITPDQTVKQSKDDTANKIDTQLQAATAYLNK
ncbi:MAG: S41 family peptidase [Candidatus Saccharimonadales bacterium]